MIQDEPIHFTRESPGRLDAMVRENEVLSAALARAQLRCTRVINQQVAEIGRLNTALLKSRALLAGKDATLSALLCELARLQALVTELEGQSSV
jgi:hypothetical protein